MHAVTLRSALFALILLVLACAADIGVAQAGLDNTPIPINSEATDSLGLALGDMDGDGDLDVALANKSVPSQVFRNDGAGNFGLAWQQSQFVAPANDVKWGDLDGDGDLDLVLVYKDAASQVYRNDANQNPANGQLFAAVWQSPVAGVDTQGLAIGDLDGDGRLDLVFVTAAAGTQVYANLGNLAFRLAVEVALSAKNVDLGDMDGDGDLDIGLASQYLPVLRNMGDFTFEQLQLTNAFGNFVGVRWGDGESDGDLDLVAIVGEFDNVIYFLRNNGGIFELVPVRNHLVTNRLSDVVWDDYDSDGDIDIIVGNELYVSEKETGCGCVEVLANDGSGTFTKVWDSLPDRPGFASVALGDLDMDGDLDIAGGTFRGISQLVYNRSRYYQQNSVLALNNYAATDFGGPAGPHRTVVADLDTDGDLDLLDSQGFVYRLYRNDGERHFIYANWGIPTPSQRSISAIAAGDMDLDGDLDLAIGFIGSPPQVLRNDGNFIFTEVWEASGDVAATNDIVWADMDGDDFLDMVLGSAVYRNQSNNQFVKLWSDASQATTLALAVQDVDLDGDADIALARNSMPPVVMRNDGLGQFEQMWGADISARIVSDIAFGDLDGDSLPDLVLGSGNATSQILQNVGGSHFELRVDIPLDDRISSVSLGDVDADGDLDVAMAGNGISSSIWVLENRGAYQFRLGWRSTPKSSCFFCQVYDSDMAIWADIDSDSALDLIVGGDTTGTWEVPATNIYSKPGSHTSSASSKLPVVAVQPPNSAGAATGGVGRIASEQHIPVPFLISKVGKAPLVWLDAAYSVNGGGSWTKLAPSVSAWRPGDSVYTWDTFASGFFGQSDYVVFRLRALAQSPVPYPADTFRYSNVIAGPFQYAPRSSVSSPFRVRGTQVRVMTQDGTPAIGAVVYKAPATANAAGSVITASDGQPYRTSGQGWLQGRGQIMAGDRLLALAPVRTADKYTLFYTNGQPQAVGLNDYTVSQFGVQTLTVSAQYPLLLFDLVISLEWDASGDAVFVNQLAQDLQKTSAALYDWSNGQAALGKITVYQDRQQWDTADVRIFASNQVRPSANRGGIVSDTLVLASLQLTEPITATRGEIRIGPEWNRYGDVKQIGDDWPRVLAHEIAHYALFLEDTYLGLDLATGLLVPVESCTGTAMSDPYEDASSELRSDYASWQSQCSQTLAELPDWSLMQLAYPELVTPQAANAGPSLMPYGFTNVTFQPAPASAPPLLYDATIAIDGAGLAGGRAYLLQNSTGRIVDLGRAGATSVLARGARW